MAELLYPYYRIQADGPAETAFQMQIHIEEGGGGPLAGQTSQGVLDDLCTRLRGDNGDVTVTLTRVEITTTTNL